MDIGTQYGSISAETAYIELFEQSSSKMEAGKLLAMTEKVLKGMGVGIRNHQGTRQVKVQFNPSSLQFSSDSGEREKRVSVSRQEDDIVYQADVTQKETPITVEMQLIFDRSIYIDDSVEEEVEGFLAMMQNPKLRLLAFAWGTQYYRGILKSVDAEYTMFNRNGIPVQANVNLAISLI